MTTFIKREIFKFKTGWKWYLLGVILFVFLPNIIDNYQVYKLEQMEASEFFIYHKVEPSKRVFTQDEELKMTSFLDVYRKVDFKWNDILRCDYNDGNGFTFVGSQDSAATNVSVGESKTSTWVWNGTKPQTPANCIVEANVKADVGQGVIKHQKIISDDFRIE